MMRHIWRLLLTGLAMACAASSGATAAAAQSPVRAAAEVTAIRTQRPPVVDGKLTDECWALARPVSEFTQRDPDEGKPATEHTEIRVLYDDDAVYIGARLFDGQP